MDPELKYMSEGCVTAYYLEAANKNGNHCSFKLYDDDIQKSGYVFNRLIETYQGLSHRKGLDTFKFFRTICGEYITYMVDAETYSGDVLNDLSEHYKMVSNERYECYKKLIDVFTSKSIINDSFYVNDLLNELDSDWTDEKLLNYHKSKKSLRGK